MPNWVTNRIKFKNKAAFDAFKAMCVKTVVGDDGKAFETFDFNTIASKPQDLDIESGSRTTDGIALALDMLERGGIPGAKEMKAKVEALIGKTPFFGFSLGSKQKDIDETRKLYEEQGKLDEVLELGKKAIANLLTYGHVSWYSWSIEHWGTKWNACQYRDDPNELEVWFETAWSMPAPILTKLVEEMGTQGFAAIEWADEDIGNNCGFFIFNDGHGIPMYHDNGSNAAMECAVRLNNAYDYYEFKDGEWRYKEDEE